MKKARKISEITIDEFMTMDIISIGPNVRLENLRQLFDEHNFNAIPVIEDNKLVGIVNKVDFMMIFRKSLDINFKKYSDLMQFPVKDIMRQAVITVGPKDTIEKALEYMIGFRLRGIPVVDGKKNVLGIVSRNDILKKLMQEDLNNK